MAGAGTKVMACGVVAAALCGCCGGGVTLGLAMAPDAVGDVRGELEQLEAHGALKGDDGCIGDREADSSLVRGIVGVRDGAGDEVSQHV